PGGVRRRRRSSLARRPVGYDGGVVGRACRDPCCAVVEERALLGRWWRSEPLLCRWLRSEPCERLETTGGGTTAASSVELVETLRRWVVAVFGFREGRGLLVPGRRRRLPGSGFRGVCLWTVSGPP